MLANNKMTGGSSHKTRNRIIGVSAIVAVIILVLLLRSCGGNTTPDDTVNQDPTPSITDTQTPGPNDTDEQDYHMYLRGDKRVELTEGDTFIDEGVEIRDKDGKACPEKELEVTIEGEVNTAVPGRYVITYKFGDEVLKRTVFVYAKEDPDDNNQPGEGDNTNPGTTTPPTGNPDDGNNGGGNGDTNPSGKQRYDMTGVSFNNSDVTYDGRTHSIHISGNLPAGVRVTYEGNARVNAGSYLVTAHFYGDDDHEPIPDMTAQLTIRKAYYDMSDVEFNDATVKYDGRAHSIFVDEATLPDGVTVRYTGNGKTNPGTYTVTAHFSGDTMNYHSISPMKATLTILSDGEGEKPSYDMSQVYFNDKTVTYDGNTHSIFISGKLPDGVSVSYTGNGRINAGSYTVTAHFTGSADYNPIPDMTATLTISKANYDMSDVSFSDSKVTYDGKPHSIYISGTLPEGVSVRYEGNGKTEVGSYTVTAIFTGDSNHNPISNMTATLTIHSRSSEKPSYDMSGVTFEDKTVTYDGDPHSIFISGTLPTGVSVTYENNGKINAGTYLVTAHFTGSADYNPISDMTATLKINKANYDMSDVSFNDSNVTYDGKPHSIFISGNLPEGVSVRYEGNNKTEVGSYTVTAIFTGDSNHNPISNMTATLTIHSKSSEKPSYDMSGVTFEDKTVTYDGNSHSIAISGTLPTGVSVSYDNNGKTNAGTYLVTAHFTGSADYNPIPDMTATLTINKATYNMSGVSFNNITVTYDGKPHSIFISGTLPEGVSVRYEGNDKTEVGSYTVTAIFTGDSNHNPISNKTATLTIQSPSEKPSYDMSGVTFDDKTVTYDGDPHSIFISGTLPTGVSVSYENNGQTNADTYTVIAHFTGASDHKPIPDMSAKLIIQKATYNMTGVKFEDVTATYNGNPHSIAISGTLPAGVSVTYSDDKGNSNLRSYAQTDVGTYKVTANFTGDSNHNPISSMTATLTINAAEKPSYDMSGVTFEGKTVTYDGDPHSIFISGTLPAGVSVSYENNGQTNAGPYLVTAHFTGADDHKPIEDKTATLTIKKATFDAADVTFGPFQTPYNGTMQTMTFGESLPVGVTVDHYDDNVHMNVGDYRPTVHFKVDLTNYETPATTSKTTEWKIVKATVNTGSLTFPAAETKIEHDGNEHSYPRITGSLPAGVSDITYAVDKEPIRDVGTYTITAHFVVDTENYNTVSDYVYTVEIWTDDPDDGGNETDPDKKENVDTGSLTFPATETRIEHDGNEHSYPRITGSLPAGVSDITYAVDKEPIRDVGTYTITAHFVVDEEHYNTVEDYVYTVVIWTDDPDDGGNETDPDKKENVDTGSLTFPATETRIEHDGNEHSYPRITGSLPAGVSDITYAVDKEPIRDVGTYTITAHFVVDTDHYNTVSDYVYTIVIWTDNPEEGGNETNPANVNDNPDESVNTTDPANVINDNPDDESNATDPVNVISDNPDEENNTADPVNDSDDPDAVSNTTNPVEAMPVNSSDSSQTGGGEAGTGVYEEASGYVENGDGQDGDEADEERKQEHSDTETGAESDDLSEEGGEE